MERRGIYVDADLHIALQDEVIHLKGSGDRIELLYPSVRRFFKTLREFPPFDYPCIVTLDRALKGFRLTVVLKTNNLSFSILGFQAKPWAMFAFRIFLPTKKFT